MMDSGLKAALELPVVHSATLVHIELPGDPDPYDLRLSSGGQQTFGGYAYTGLDTTFGALGSVRGLSDGVGNEVSSASMVLHPKSDAAIEVLASPGTQDSPVVIRQATIDPDDGSLIGTEQLWAGAVNYAVLVADANQRSLRVELVTDEARALERNDERRLSHSFHQSVWPGELGLVHVTGVAEKDFWRVDKPNPSTYAGGGGGGVSPGEIVSRWVTG